MKKNRILLISPYSATKVGGIGTWSKNVLEYTKEDNIDLIFLNTAFPFKSNIVKGQLSRIIWGIIDSALIISKMLFFLLFKRPSVIHYTSSASMALPKDIIAVCISRLFFTKFILHLRFGRVPELVKLQNLEWKLLRIAIKLSSVCIVIDKKSFKCLLEQNFTNVVLIPNLISNELEETGRSNSVVKRKITIGKIVFVGHVVATKGIYELVRACRDHNEIRELHIVGPFDEELKVELLKIGTIRDDGNWLYFHGEKKREYVIQILKDSNALCLPSYTEGFPNVILEAMASACAVVATNVGAIEEMINVGSESPCGIIVEPRNVSQLESALLRVIHDPLLAHQFGRNGLEKVLNEYSRNIVMSKLKELWGY